MSTNDSVGAAERRAATVRQKGDRAERRLRRVRMRSATVVVIIFVLSGAFGLENIVGWSGLAVLLLTGPIACLVLKPA